MENYWDNETIKLLGKLGVVLFFVLSGFLISYLLMLEQKQTNTIRILDFYKRRMLRVWPLYFLIIIAALFILPFTNFFNFPGFDRELIWEGLALKIILYIFFLPNLVNLMGFIPYAAQTWSIGCEEQFYLAWPVLNKIFRNKWKLVSGTIIFYLLVKFILLIYPSTHFTLAFSNYWNSTPFDCMAIGGLFAVLLQDEKRRGLRKLLFAKSIQWLVFAGVVIFISFGFDFRFFHNEVYSLLFGILIVNLAANPERIFSLEFRGLNYLGKISYGIYMYHPVAIVMAIKLFQQNPGANNFILLPLIFLFVIIISAVSYELFEKRFIRMKIKYSKIISGDNSNLSV